MMDNELFKLIREDVVALNNKMDRLDDKFDNKLDSLEGKYVSKDSFATLRNIVVGLVTTTLGYLGFDLTN